MLVARRPDEKQFEAWRRGVVLEDGDKTAPADVSFISSSGKGAWIRIVMGEGKKRQIREVGRLLGLPVVKIIRLRIGTLKLGNLKPRQWRHLTENEVMDLKGEKGKMVENRGERARDNRRHPTDRPRQIAAQRSGKKDSPKLAHNERPRTKDRTEKNRKDHSRNTTKPRTARR